MRFALVIVCGLTACSSSLQSARVLSRGKTAVTVGASRSSLDGREQKVYLGSLQVRHGVSDSAEIGVHLDRTPGGGETTSVLGIDPKFMLSSTATSAISLVLPVSLGWNEQYSDFKNPAFIAAPTLLLGVDVSSEVELVLAPRIGLARGTGDGSLYGFGGSLGLHIGKRGGAAIHPELGFVSLRESGSEGSATVLTIGVGISAGD